MKVKGRAFGSPLARSLYPRASTAEVDPRAKPGAPAAVGSGNPALAASNLDPRLRGDDKRDFWDDKKDCWDDKKDCWDDKRDRGDDKKDCWDDKGMALFPRHYLFPVIPAKAGIQIKKAGFRIKSGTTTLKSHC